MSTRRSLFGLAAAGIVIAGANFAYTAGSGFGTGQEVMQFFTSYGLYGLLGVPISILCVILVDTVIYRDSRKHNLTGLLPLFRHYCGKWFGLVMFIFSIVFLFSMTAIMLAGAGSVFKEYLGIDALIGRAIMAVLMFLTAIFGLRKTVNVIGALGPLLILFIALISIVGLVSPTMDLSSGHQEILQSDMLIPANSWVLAAFMYFTYSLFFRIPYMNGLSRSRSESSKFVVVSHTLGTLIFGVLVALMVGAQISNIDSVGGVEIPNLVLSNLAGAFVGGVFGVVLMAAMYTTVVPLIWSIADSVTREGGRSFPWIVALASIVVFIISSFGAFSTLVNLVSVASLYVAILFLIPLLVRKIRDWSGSRAGQLSGTTDR